MRRSYIKLRGHAAGGGKRAGLKPSRSPPAPRTGSCLVARLSAHLSSCPAKGVRSFLATAPCPTAGPRRCFNRGQEKDRAHEEGLRCGLKGKVGAKLVRRPEHLGVAGLRLLERAGLPTRGALVCLPVGRPGLAISHLSLHHHSFWGCGFPGAASMALSLQRPASRAGRSKAGSCPLWAAFPPALSSPCHTFSWSWVLECCQKLFPVKVLSSLCPPSRSGVPLSPALAGCLSFFFGGGTGD